MLITAQIQWPQGNPFFMNYSKQEIVLKLEGRHCTKTFIPTITFKTHNSPGRWEVGSQFQTETEVQEG